MESDSPSWLLFIDHVKSNVINGPTSLEFRPDSLSPIFTAVPNTPENVHSALRHHLYVLEDVPVVFTSAYILESNLDLFTDALTDPTDDVVYGNNVLLTIEAVVKDVEPCCFPRQKASRLLELLRCLLKSTNVESFWEFRGSIVDIIRAILNSADETGRYLLLRKLYSDIMTRSIQLNLEPQVVGVIIDIYRQNLRLETFAKGLNFFYRDLLQAKYEDVEAGFPFYTAVCALFRFHALSRSLDRETLRSAKDKVLDKIRSQVEDYVQLKMVEAKKDNTETSLNSNVNLVLFCLNDTVAVVKNNC